MSDPNTFCVLIEDWANALGVQLLCQRGLQALKANARYVRCKHTRRLAGSIDLDGSLQSHFPADARWDYGVGVLQEYDLHIIWIEIHPAETSEVSAVLNKLMWLRGVLSKAPKPLREKRMRFCWVASGRVNVLKHSPQYRRLKQNRIEGPMRSVKVCQDHD